METTNTLHHDLNELIRYEGNSIVFQFQDGTNLVHRGLGTITASNDPWDQTNIVSCMVKFPFPTDLGQIKQNMTFLYAGLKWRVNTVGTAPYCRFITGNKVND